MEILWYAFTCRDVHGVSMQLCEPPDRQPDPGHIPLRDRPGRFSCTKLQTLQLASKGKKKKPSDSESQARLYYTLALTLTGRGRLTPAQSMGHSKRLQSYMDGLKSTPSRQLAWGRESDSIRKQCPRRERCRGDCRP